MRKKLLAATALAGVLFATPAPAQFAVIDVANLQQNVQQTLNQITELIRLLRQIELLTQQVVGTDFSLSPDLIGSLQDVQRVLDAGTAIVFQEAESLEQFQNLFPEVFAAIDTLQGIVDVVRGQTQQILDASQQAVQSQSVERRGDPGHHRQCRRCPCRVQCCRRSDPCNPGRATRSRRRSRPSLPRSRDRSWLRNACKRSTWPSRPRPQKPPTRHALASMPKMPFIGAGGHTPPGWE